MEHSSSLRSLLLLLTTRHRQTVIRGRRAGANLPLVPAMRNVFIWTLNFNAYYSFDALYFASLYVVLFLQYAHFIAVRSAVNGMLCT